MTFTGELGEAGVLETSLFVKVSDQGEKDKACVFWDTNGR